MDDHNLRLGFAFGIQFGYSENLIKPTYLVQTANKGVSQEMILSIVRAWLKTEEQKFHQEFSENHIV